MNSQLITSMFITILMPYFLQISSWLSVILTSQLSICWENATSETEISGKFTHYSNNINYLATILVSRSWLQEPFYKTNNTNNVWPP